jgi:hypothetical protein
MKMAAAPFSFRKICHVGKNCPPTHRFELELAQEYPILTADSPAVHGHKKVACRQQQGILLAPVYRDDQNQKHKVDWRIK